MGLTGTAAATGAPPRPAPGTGWRRLPRDARDTLFLLAVIGQLVLPHLAHVPAWTGALVALVLLWRARLALRQQPLPGRWVLVAVLALALALTAWSHGTLFGRDAGVTLVIVLMALKTLELRARRDAFVVFFLGFFVVLTQFLHSQSILVALSMLVSVWGLLTALVLAHMPAGVPALGRAAALAARCALLGMPLMALLFVLFPRVGPLWGVPAEGQARTGLSASMQLGSMSELAVDDSVAMRLRFEGAPPPPEALYFRGPVLTQFDGREWLALPPRAAPVDAARGGRPVAYVATLEPTTVAVLPLLEFTTSLPQLDAYVVRRTADGQVRLDLPLRERVRIAVEADTAARLGPFERTAAVDAALELPDGANPRTRAWAEALAQRARGADALAGAVLAHIRRGGYVYTLAPGVYGGSDGRNAVDEFWIDRRSGFCEHFAAAFVVVMRAAGVPARVVTGYQGADPQAVDGWTIVRQSNAHAWAEYWQPGRGWTRADPTAAVAPERIVRSRRLAPPPGFVESALGGVDPVLWQRFRNGWEAIDNRWNQWVLDYSRGQQLDLLGRLGADSPDWTDLARLLGAALALLGLAGAGWAWLDRRRADPAALRAAALRRALAPIDVEVAPHDTPRALAARVTARHGAAGAALADALLGLEAARYARAAGSRPEPALLRTLRREAARLRRRARAGRAAPAG